MRFLRKDYQRTRDSHQGKDIKPKSRLWYFVTSCGSCNDLMVLLAPLLSRTGYKPENNETLLVSVMKSARVRLRPLKVLYLADFEFLGFHSLPSNFTFRDLGLQVKIESQHGNHRGQSCPWQQAPTKFGSRRLQQLQNPPGRTRVPPESSQRASQVPRRDSKRGYRRETHHSWTLTNFETRRTGTSRRNIRRSCHSAQKTTHDCPAGGQIFLFFRIDFCFLASTKRILKF